MKFTVMKEDIEKGVPEHASKCAVARAIRREFPRRIIKVEIDSITIGRNEYPTPRKVIDWLDRFDGLVKPFPKKEFTFDLPVE